LGNSSLDFLLNKGIEVIKIFAPEHGFRGNNDAGKELDDDVDNETKLPIISLYGPKKKPSILDLEDIDVLVFDIQDVGVRFYTYLSTLHYAMEACAENNIPLLVMDRPNPHANYIDGPIMQKDCNSFVGLDPVPIVYGMTIGEYAQMLNGEKWLKNGIRSNLKVIPIRNWKRSAGYTINYKPSPNLPDSISVILYPSLCLFEGTVISLGRGTILPFKCYGHPNLINMPYEFTPVSIPGKSKHPKCEGLLCHGENLTNQYNLIKNSKSINLKWLIKAFRSYKGEKPFFNSYFKNLAGTSKLEEEIKAGKSEYQIKKDWQTELANFKKIRQKYLIY